MYIYNGQNQAEQLETKLKNAVQTIKNQGGDVGIAAVLFKEDSGSRYYSSHKQQAAARVGISYQLSEFSMSDSPEDIKDAIRSLNREDWTGIIIQKPVRSIWESHSGRVGESQKFSDWWQDLYQSVDVSKDVDGLHPDTINSIKDGTWQEKGRVLPATCRAVLGILEHPEAKKNLRPDSKYLIIGISDLLGIPLKAVLEQQGRKVELIGRREFKERQESGIGLTDADAVISATGRTKLITGGLIKVGAVLIDVGEPNPDIDLDGVASKAAFATPVPGGVGPLTVISLLENALALYEQNQQN